MDYRRRNIRVPTNMSYCLPTAVFILSLVGACLCKSVAPAENITVSSTQPTQTTAAIHPTNSSLKPLELEAKTTASPTTKESGGTTKANSARTAAGYSTTDYASTEGVVKSARRQKFNSSSSAAARPERFGAVDCDLPVLPRESRLWRGNETHELNLPITACASGEDCPPVVVSWEGAADIQSGDILIVRIADSSLLDSFAQPDLNSSRDANATHTDRERVHRTLPQPAVYQVTRQGHVHCDVSEGMLLDITPLDERGAKLITLYDKDLTEGVNLLIVVSENWGSQCVRLKVTVKSDNCGEAQDCSSKGVCYTNVSMEGYECQCCPGHVGPHCEERDVCNPSPCLNNGICVDLTQPLNGANYHCLCPYGFTGRKCEKDPCYSEPCLNGGSCMSLAMNGSTTFHCACADGWAGAHCELPTVGGACADKPCVNGICIEQTDMDAEGHEYRCFCLPGYTGEHCEMEYNECESSPCANGGTCTDRVGGFACACSRGYTGNTCQLKVDLCSPNACPPQRFCVDRGNSYSCECPHGYVGEECHLPAKSVCDTNPCAHGGTCWSGMDSFYCSCRPGYTGKLCDEDFILETVARGAGPVARAGGSVRELRLPLGLYHDRLHNVYIAAGTLGAAIAIVGVVVGTAVTSLFILETVARGAGPEARAGGSVRELRLPLGLYHDRLHNVYIAAGTLGAAIAIVGVVVGTAVISLFILETVARAGGSVRELRLPLGLYHDRLHNVYIAAGTLGAAIAIVGVVVGTAVISLFILETVARAGGSVRELRLPLGLYHDRLHNVYIAAGTLGAAIAIVGVVVTACHCRVNKTYSRLLSRLSRGAEPPPPPHWLHDKRAPAPPAPPALDTTDMYYTLDFSDSQSSPLIQ